MFKRRFIFLSLSILLFVLTLTSGLLLKPVYGKTPLGYLNETDFKIDYIEKELEYLVYSNFESDINRHYILPNGYDSFIHASEFDYERAHGVMKITSPVNKLVIQSYDGSKTLYEATTNYIIIDSTNSYYGLYVTFETNSGTFVWDFNKMLGVRIFFEGKIDYRPALSGEESFIVDIDNPVSLESIQTYFKAYDDVDGDLTSEIFVEEDNYSNNINKPGDYHIIFGVTDSSGNSSYLKVLIYLVDLTPPTIGGDFNKITISYNEVFDLDNFFNSLVVTDNYQNELNVSITTNTYIDYSDEIGTYKIEVTATDESGNQTKKSKEIVVVDQIKPVISGPLEVRKSINEYIPIKDFISKLSAYDEYDGNLTNEITIHENGYEEAMYQAGIVKIIFKVIDKSGNEGYFELTVEVVDQEQPLFYVSNQVVITTPLTYHLDEAMILKLLKNHYLFTEDIATLVSVDYNKFNKDVEGVYRINFDYKINGDEEKVKTSSLLINVYNPNNYGDSGDDNISGNNNTFMYLIIGSIGLLLLSVGGLYYFYVKQKR